MRQGHVTDLLGPWISVLVLSAEGKLPMPLLQAAQQAAHTLPLRLALITRNPPASTAIDIASRLSTQAVLQYACDPAGKLFALYGATVGKSPATEPSLTVYVVRPDGHVCARWHQSPEADGSVLQQALRRLCGEAAA
jgi:hypothetical protein